MKKYEITDRCKAVKGTMVYQIRALVDIPIYHIKAGDLGGWLTAEGIGLCHEGNAWLHPFATLLSSHVYGDTLVVKGIIENSKIKAKSISCAHIEESVINGTKVVIDDSTVISDSIIISDGEVEVKDNVRLFGMHIEGEKIEIYGECVLKKSTIKGSGIIIQGTSKMNGSSIKSDEVTLIDSHLDKGTDILATCVVVSNSELREMKVNGENIVISSTSFFKGVIRASISTFRGNVEIYNAHIEGKNIHLDGNIKLYNCSIYGNGFNISDEAELKWVYFRGDGITLNGIVHLTGKGEAFQIKENVVINGFITMKIKGKSIQLKDETVEGDFVFES
jgi:hypothetical protein